MRKLLVDIIVLLLLFISVPFLFLVHTLRYWLRDAWENYWYHCLKPTAKGVRLGLQGHTRREVELIQLYSELTDLREQMQEVIEEIDKLDNQGINNQ